MAESKKKSSKKAELVAEITATEESKDTPEPIKEMKVEEEKATAKAGKRSSKAQKESEDKQAKEERKKTSDKENEKPKQAKNPTRSKVERAGKNYRQAAKLIEKDKVYSLAEALALAVKTNPSKFDAAVEVHINLNVDPKQADQNVRGTVALPAGTGKAVKIAVLADEAEAKKAKAAGAEVVDSQEIFGQLDREQVNFDVLIATPAQMPNLGKYARLLGPRGLMPNPKSGTVTNDVDKAVSEAKAGRIEYRVDSQGILHFSIGKASFGPEKLKQNADAALSSIKNAKPASVKGTYIKSAFLATSMGPSIKTEV